MSRFLKILTILFMVALLAPLVALLTYDVVAVRPHLAEIRVLLENAAPEDRHPPPLLVELLRAEDPSTVRCSLVRTLVWKFYGDERISHLRRHGRDLLWSFFLWLHFSEEERDALYCSQIYMGKEQIGFSVVAKELYNRPLSDLTLEELATIVVIPRRPTLRGHPEELAEMRDLLLARYKATPKAWDQHR